MGFRSKREEDNTEALKKLAAKKEASKELSTNNSAPEFTTKEKYAMGAEAAKQVTAGAGDESAAGVAGSTAQGALTGAAMTGGNPVGAAVGGAVGLGTGLAKASAARKARKAKAESDKFQALANIEQTRGAQQQNSIQSMLDAFRAALIRG